MSNVTDGSPSGGGSTIEAASLGHGHRDAAAEGARHHEEHGGAPGWGDPLADHVGHGLCAPVEHCGLPRTVPAAGAADGTPDVLFVGPAVDDSGLHELAIGDLTHRAQSHLVELRASHGGQGTKTPAGDFEVLGQHLVTGEVASGLDP